MTAEYHDEKTRQELTAINDENFADLNLQLGLYGQTYRGPDVKWAYTGCAALNRIMDCRFSSQNAEDRISELLAMFDEWGVKPAWCTSPPTTPVDLDERLVSRGYHFIPWKGMAMELKDLPDDMQLPEGFEISEITDASMVKPWADVIARGFGWIEAIHKPVADLFIQLGVCNSIPWKHYLGFLDGKPASAVTVYHSAGVTGVYFVAVAPEARRRGLGIVTTWYSLNVAKDEGHKRSVLQASPMGKGVYEKLGFKTHCDQALLLPFVSSPE